MTPNTGVLGSAAAGAPARPAPSGPDSRPKLPSLLAILVILGGMALSTYHQTLVPGEVFLSGDAGLKALQVKQLLAGNLRFDLKLPGPAWAHAAWAQGLFPYEPPFVHQVGARYFVQYPFPYALLSVPFFAALGFRGLYLLPLLSLWALWWIFFLQCRRRGLTGWELPASALLLGVSSPVLIYGSIVSEHVLALAVAAPAIFAVVVPGTPAAPRTAFLWGGLLGAAAWLRSELLCLVAAVIALVLASVVLRRPLAVPRRPLALGMGAALAVMLLANLAVYGRLFGVHGANVLNGQSLREQVSAGVETLTTLNPMLVYSFPAMKLFLVLTIPILLVRRAAHRWPLGLLLLAIVLFDVSAPFIVPNYGGVQWGPRYLFIIVPMATACFALAFRAAWSTGRWWLRVPLLLAFAWTSYDGFRVNALGGTAWLKNDYGHRVYPALVLARQPQFHAVAVDHQWTAQELEAVFDSKPMFLVNQPAQVRTLAEAMLEAGADRVLYLAFRDAIVSAGESQLPGSTIWVKRTALGRVGGFDALDLQFSRRQVQ